MDTFYIMVLHENETGFHKTKRGLQLVRYTIYIKQMHNSQICIILTLLYYYVYKFTIINYGGDYRLR